MKKTKKQKRTRDIKVIQTIVWKRLDLSVEMIYFCNGMVNLDKERGEQLKEVECFFILGYQQKSYQRLRLLHHS